MTPPPTVFQRRIVIGAVICVMAFALVGARLIDVTVLKSGAAAIGLRRWAMLSCVR